MKQRLEGVPPMVLLAGFAVLIFLALLFTMRRQSKGPRHFAEGRVTGVCGRKGHGKTLLLVHEMLRHLLRGAIRCTDPICEGRRHAVSIASNFTLQVPSKYEGRWSLLQSWADMAVLPHGTLCVIDEAHIRGWAPAVASQTLPDDVQWLLSQCRKLHIEIIWCSQSVDRVALGLRRQTDEVAVCRKGMFRQMRVKYYEPEDVNGNKARPGQRPNWVYSYRVTRKLARAYNTFELIAPEGNTESSAAIVSIMEARRRGAGVPRNEAPAPDRANEDTAG